MFKRTLCILAIVTAGFISAPASADFIHTDWKTAGDKQAALDTETGIEWLNLTQTNGKTITQVTDLLNTTYSGWRLPTYTEVSSMITRFFGNPTSWNAYSTSNGMIARDFSVLFGTGSTETAYNLGTHRTDTGQLRYSGAYVNGANVEFSAYSVYYGPTNTTKPPRGLGVFLVSDGGTTLSSINNPNLNINNPAAPVNQAAPAPTDVSAPIGLGLAGLLLLLMGRRKA